jgi:hypothetical protein
MKASVGDRIVIASDRLDRPTRDGRIIECRNADGSPPYLIEWSDTGRTALFFPGSDAHVEHQADTKTPHEPSRHVKTWRVELHLFESEESTTAHATLLADAPGIDAVGRARRRHDDANVPEIGDEVAAARALRRLADRLLGTAADDIAAVEGHPVSLRP